MRKAGLILRLLLLAPFSASAAVATPTVESPAVESPAVEKLYVRAQPAVALLATPTADAVVVRRLTPGDALTALGRQAGFVNVQTADGIQGWLREPDVTAAAPPAQQVTQLEQELAALRRQLAAAQTSLRAMQTELQQARQVAGAARDAGADRAAELQTQNEGLQRTLATRDEEIATLTGRVAQMEMAQEAGRLLATSRPADGGATPPRFTPRELAVAAAAGLLLLLAGVGLGARAALRRLRRRYHGLEL